MSALYQVEDHVIVCGFGGTGRLVARDLADEGLAVVVVDKLQERVGRAETEGHMSILGDVLDPECLTEAGIDRARGIIFTMPSDSDNLLATMTARELNADVFIIARNTTEHVRGKLLGVGANRVVNPFDQTGVPIGSEFIRPAVMDLMRIFSESEDSEKEVRVREITVQAGSALAGKSLRDVDVRARYDVIVIAMRKAGHSARFNPDPSREIEPGDVLVCMGRLANLGQIAELGHEASS